MRRATTYVVAEIVRAGGRPARSALIGAISIAIWRCDNIMYNNNAFDLFGSCLVGLCFLAVFILTLVAMFWVYRDAEARGKTGCLWVLLISATGPLGVIAYFVLRDREVRL
jgi:hypothetical protein